MFYSETLLSKTGPLARVWLSANLERKLSKTHILQSNIENSVSAIVDQGQAPMALRLSGQLLLGVVRIYSRKARYLLDDCNEALMKLKMTFRPGNVDLPAHQIQPANPTSLTLPDVLTELDLLPTMPDPSLLLSQDISYHREFDFARSLRGDSEEITLDHSSQLLENAPNPGPDQPPKSRGAKVEFFEDNFDFRLDDAFGLKSGFDRSIEIGRGAEPMGNLEDEHSLERLFEIDHYPTTLHDDTVVTADGPSAWLEADGERADLDLHDDLGLGLDKDQISELAHLEGPMPSLLADGLDDPAGHIPLDFNASLVNGINREKSSLDIDSPPPLVNGHTSSNRSELSDSPLSSVRSSVERELAHNYQLEFQKLDRTFEESQNTEEDEDQSIQAAQLAKKRKLFPFDQIIEMKSQHIKSWQSDHTHIMQPASLFPLNHQLLSLMTMDTDGFFVSDIVGDTRLNRWAPEIGGLLSLDSVQKAASRKRKRGGPAPEISEEEEAMPAMPSRPENSLGNGLKELPNGITNSDSALHEDLQNNDLPAEQPMTSTPDEELIAFTNGDNLTIRSKLSQTAPGDDDEQTALSPVVDNFDETIAPLVHPADSGPISLATKHVVHLLRDRFGEQTSSEDSSSQQHTMVHFDELVPEQRATKVDATKLFFELLVLATKDAVKVDQDHKLLGEKIRVRAKRGLWGAWAAKEAGGEIANQETREKKLGDSEEPGLEPVLEEVVLDEAALQEVPSEEESLEEVALEEESLEEVSLAEGPSEEESLQEIALEEESLEDVVLEEESLEEIALDEISLDEISSEEEEIASQEA